MVGNFAGQANADIKAHVLGQVWLIEMSSHESSGV
jgi:hypothetical protein